MKKILLVLLAGILVAVCSYAGFTIFGKQIKVKVTNGYISLSLKDLYAIEAASTQYEWVNAIPRQTDDTHFEWINGVPYIYMNPTASGSTYDISNSPSSENFAVVSPSTTYYAGGSAYSNPVTDAQCTFTITNSQSNAIKITIKESNPTGGVGWTLVGSSPGANQIEDIAVVSGTNPASGVVLTTSDQVLIASLAGSATKKWDLERITGSSFTDGVQKSSTITLTGISP